jgi:hypothetical protein
MWLMNIIDILVRLNVNIQLHKYCTVSKVSWTSWTLRKFGVTHFIDALKTLDIDTGKLVYTSFTMLACLPMMSHDACGMSV